MLLKAQNRTEPAANSGLWEAEVSSVKERERGMSPVAGLFLLPIKSVAV